MFSMPLLIICSLSLFSVPAFADSAPSERRAFALIKENLKEVHVGSVQELYTLMLRSYESKHWDLAVRQALLLLQNFPKTSFAEEATYYLASSYFHLGEFELSNIQFTYYLTHQSTPKHFEEAIEHKFLIAEKFREGARKHLMGFKLMPKWISGNEEAIAAYDEVIAALPHHELAAKALFGKAEVLAKRGDFRESIEVYQTLIRRFPKHALAVESYLKIGQIYLGQSQTEYPDPDFLELAQLNLRKFKEHFPLDEAVAKAEEHFKQMQEHYALHLFDIARFYERTKKWGAARIYYMKILKSYPDAQIARKCEERLSFVETELAKKKPS